MRKQEIGRAIRDARLAAGLSINELSHQIHTPPSTISRIERGATQPRRTTLTKLNRVLKIFNLPRTYDVADPELQEIIDFVSSADQDARGYLLTAVRRLKALPARTHPKEGIAESINTMLQSAQGLEKHSGTVTSAGRGERAAGRARSARRSSTRRVAR